MTKACRFILFVFSKKKINTVIVAKNPYLFFRQSIDLYSSVPSPSIGFLGTPSLTRFGSSFLSSSLTRRHTPESLGAVTKPLLPTVEDEKLPQQRRSSYSLLPPISSRRSSIKKDDKASKVSHELPISRQSSYAQAVLNGKHIWLLLKVLMTDEKLW